MGGFSLSNRSGTNGAGKETVGPVLDFEILKSDLCEQMLQFQRRRKKMISNRRASPAMDRINELPASCMGNPEDTLRPQGLSQTPRDRNLGHQMGKDIETDHVVEIARGQGERRGRTHS